MEAVKGSVPTSHTHTYTGGFVGTLEDESVLFMCPRNDFHRMCVKKVRTMRACVWASFHRADGTLEPLWSNDLHTPYHTGNAKGNTNVE